MAEPTSSYTLGDLMLRVAKAAAVAYHGANGDEKAQVPVDDCKFYQVLDCVNDGIRMFIASAPPEGWRWMSKDAEILFDAEGDGPNNIASDPARYLLPEDFQGEIAGPITYKKDSGRGRIEWRSEAEIRKLREISVITGCPRFAAIKPSPTLRRWELIVHPAPSSADTVTFPYKAGFTKFDVAPQGDLTGKHPAGIQFDEAILAACLAKAEMEFEDLKLGYMDKFLSMDLPKAYEIDARSAPRKLGVMLPGTRKTGYERIWNTVVKKE